MKNKTKLTGLELNCIEVAVQHLIDELEDALKDKMDSFYVYKSLKERLNATQSARKNFGI